MRELQKRDADGKVERQRKVLSWRRADPPSGVAVQKTQQDAAIGYLFGHFRNRTDYFNHITRSQLTNLHVYSAVTRVKCKVPDPVSGSTREHSLDLAMIMTSNGTPVFGMEVCLDGSSPSGVEAQQKHKDLLIILVFGYIQVNVEGKVISNHFRG